MTREEEASILLAYREFIDSDPQLDLLWKQLEESVINKYSLDLIGDLLRIMKVREQQIQKLFNVTNIRNE